MRSPVRERNFQTQRGFGGYAKGVYEMTIEKIKTSFFDRPGIEMGTIDVADGIPFGIEHVTNPSVGIGGVYGTWGTSYDNETLPDFLEERLGRPLEPNQK